LRRVGNQPTELPSTILRPPCTLRSSGRLDAAVVGLLLRQSDVLVGVLVGNPRDPEHGLPRRHGHGSGDRSPVYELGVAVEDLDKMRSIAS
jgi:hypothetical protein